MITLVAVIRKISGEPGSPFGLYLGEKDELDQWFDFSAERRYWPPLIPRFPDFVSCVGVSAPGFKEAITLRDCHCGSRVTSRADARERVCAEKIIPIYGINPLTPGVFTCSSHAGVTSAAIKAAESRAISSRVPFPSADLATIDDYERVFGISLGIARDAVAFLTANFSLSVAEKIWERTWSRDHPRAFIGVISAISADGGSDDSEGCDGCVSIEGGEGMDIVANGGRGTPTYTGNDDE